MASVAGSPRKGAGWARILSRSGASLPESPPSCASAQTRVAGWSERHSARRGPVGTLPLAIGIDSWSGRSASCRTLAPAAFQISIRVGKLSAGTRYEKGSCRVSTSSQAPSGEGSSREKSAGLPSFSILPSRSTRTSCELM